MSTASMMPSLQTAVQNLASGFADAWNRHDAKALAEFFTEDGDLVNPAGRAAHGKQEVERLFAEEHAGALRATQMRHAVGPVRILSPDIVVTTNQCQITGMRNPAGEECAMNAMATFVLKNENGKWRIAVARAMVPVTPPK